MTRYIAQFTPEVWVNNYAVTQDWRQEWDITEGMTELATTHPDYHAVLLVDIRDNEVAVDNDDWFASDKNAPRIVKEWVKHHPFTIRITEEKEEV